MWTPGIQRVPTPGGELCPSLGCVGTAINDIAQSPTHLLSLSEPPPLVLAPSVDKLLVLKDQDWNDFLQQLCSQIDSSEKSTGASRAKLNLLCYLCVVATHREVATRLLHSPLVRAGRVSRALRPQLSKASGSAH